MCISDNTIVKLPEYKSKGYSKKYVAIGNS